jgi:hypothetical protein
MSLIPPSEAPVKAVKVPKEPKAKKEPKAPRDPNAAKNMMNRDATIRVDLTKEVKYRGQRLEWFERVKAFDGKTVKEFSEGNKGIANGKGTVQAPGGWLSFYVRDKSVILENPPAAAEAA